MTFPNLLLIGGLVLLLIGLLGKIRIKEFEAGTNSKPIRVIVCLLGAVLLVGAFLFYKLDKPSPPDNPRIANTNSQPTPPPSTDPTPSPQENANTNSQPTPSPPSIKPTPGPQNRVYIEDKKEREAYERMIKALCDERWTWRSIEQLKAIGRVTDDEVLDILRRDPNVKLGKLKDGRRGAMLKTKSSCR